jgi:hypothetical protein
VIASEKIPLFAITFTVAYAVIYAICTELNLPLLTYHPAIGELDFLWKPEKRGPSMYWYGWMLTSLVGAVAVAWIATAVPEQWLQRAIAFGSIGAAAYLVLYTLALFVYDQASIELEFLKSRWLSIAAAVVVAAVISLLAPASWTQRLWPGWAWVIPLGALAVLGYYLSPYFTR